MCLYALNLALLTAANGVNLRELIGVPKRKWSDPQRVDETDDRRVGISDEDSSERESFPETAR